MNQNNAFEITLIERVRTLIELKRHPEALSEAVKGLASIPDSYYLHYFKTLCHFNCGDFDEADKASRMTLSLDLENADGYFLRSLILHKKLNFIGELEMAEQAVALDPEDADNLGRLVEAQLQNGQIKQAQKTAQQIVKLEPGSLECHDQLGGICLQLSDWQGAEDEFRAMLTLQPTNIYAQQNLALALGRQNRHDEAMDILFQTVKLDSTNTAVQDRLYNTIVQQLPSPVLWPLYQAAIEKLPAPIAHFYRDRRSRQSFSVNNSALFSVLVWMGLLLVAIVCAHLFV